MIIRAIAVWFALALLAVLNGALRSAWISPRLGEHAGHIVSTFTLSGIILVVARLTITWIGVTTMRQAMTTGLVWLALTVLFEFGAGHYLFGNPWERLLADYNPLRGRVWVVVLIVTLVAPVLAVRGRGL
jgi:hypothetical protein